MQRLGASVFTCEESGPFHHTNVAAVVPSLLRRPTKQVRYRHENVTRMMSLLVC